MYILVCYFILINPETPTQMQIYSVKLLLTSLMISIGFLFLPGVGHAQTAKSILEQTFYGSSVQDANFTQSGKVYLWQEFTITTLYDDGSFVGYGKTVMKLDDDVYTYKADMKGYFNQAEWTVTYESTYDTYADALPDGLRWCKGYGTVHVYSVEGKPGHYMLQGTTHDSCGGTSSFEAVDYE